jgi:SAM-dependent methyltransferase
MQDIANKFLVHSNPISILDIGSYDVNGSYKPIFEQDGNHYVGLDMVAGPNVDIVPVSVYKFPLASNSFDLIVSGQTFEHTEFFWMTWLEMVRVIKPGGLIFLIAPSRGPEHRYPQDCWRFYPDGYRALARFGKCELLEVSTDWAPHPDPGSSDWGDTVGVFKKSKRTIYEQLVYALLHFTHKLIYNIVLSIS